MRYVMRYFCQGIGVGLGVGVGMGMIVDARVGIMEEVGTGTAVVQEERIIIAKLR